MYQQIYPIYQNSKAVRDMVLLLMLLVASPLVVPHSRPLVVLSLRRPLAVSSSRLVVASPLAALSSHPLVVLSLRHPLVI